MAIMDYVAVSIVFVAGVVFTMYGWCATDYFGEAPRKAKLGYASFAFGIGLLVFTLQQIWVIG